MTKLQELQEVMESTGAEGYELEIKGTGAKTRVVVTLANGKQIITDMVGNWQESVKKYVRKLNNK